MVNADAIADTDFQGKNALESFEFGFRQHWIRTLFPCAQMIGVSLFLAFLTSLLAGVADPTARHMLLLLLSVFFLLAQWNFIQRFLRHFITIVIVTDRRIHRIKKALMSIDSQETIDLRIVQDMAKSQRGLVQNLLGFGSIFLQVRDTQTRLHFVPHITQYYEKLSEAWQRVRTVDAQPPQQQDINPIVVPIQ